MTKLFTELLEIKIGALGEGNPAISAPPPQI